MLCIVAVKALAKKYARAGDNTNVEPLEGLTDHDFRA